jgi:hypothetical protein
MRADTQTISIDSPADAVYAFVADPTNLPRWAVEFASEVTAKDDVWLVTPVDKTPDGEVAAGMGEVSLRVVTDKTLGIVDWHLIFPGGVESVVSSRVVPRGEGSEFMFTQVQAPEMPDEMFDRFVKSVEHELSTLKALMEDERPL